MKHKNKIIIYIILSAITIYIFSAAVAAVTESEVQAHVTAHGREKVAGNIFIWFLCAVAFLKASQKIDSFMSSLGINVGNTGGSMMAELLIASRGVMAGKNAFSGGMGVLKGFGSRGSTGASGANGGAGSSGEAFLSGGLAGAVGRSFNRGAMKNATGAENGGLGGMMFKSSMEKGGEFANDVIGSVATGDIKTTGTITGENAVKAIHSYMGYTEEQILSNHSGVIVNEIPEFSNVEIGGGRIMGTETSSENPNGIQFGMYNTEQYMAPAGKYETVTATDNSTWYKQYAQDAVEKTPYMAADGSIAYNESITQKLPDIPRRKDRV